MEASKQFDADQRALLSALKNKPQTFVTCAECGIEMRSQDVLWDGPDPLCLDCHEGAPCPDCERRGCHGSCEPRVGEPRRDDRFDADRGRAR